MHNTSDSVHKQGMGKEGVQVSIASHEILILLID